MKFDRQAEKIEYENSFADYITSSIKQFDDSYHSVTEPIGKTLNIDSSGQITKEGWKELSDIMNIYSNKSYETTRFLFIKDGKIIRQAFQSCNLPEEVIVNDNDNKNIFEYLHYAESNDCQIVLIHNHPSGIVLPSDADIKKTESLINELTDSDGTSRFMGHIILDHGNKGIFDASSKEWFSIIDGKISTLDEYRSIVYADSFNNKTISDNEILNKLISYSEQLDKTDSWNTEEFIPLFFVSEDNNIRQLDYIHKSELLDPDKLKNKIKYIGTEKNSTKCFMLPTTAENNELCINFNSKTNMVTDIYCSAPGIKHFVPNYYKNRIFNKDDLIIKEKGDSINYPEQINSPHIITQNKKENKFMDNEKKIEPDITEVVNEAKNADLSKLENISMETSITNKAIDGIPGLNNYLEYNEHSYKNNKLTLEYLDFTDSTKDPHVEICVNSPDGQRIGQFRFTQEDAAKIKLGDKETLKILDKAIDGIPGLNNYLEYFTSHINPNIDLDKSYNENMKSESPIKQEQISNINSEENTIDITEPKEDGSYNIDNNNNAVNNIETQIVNHEEPLDLSEIPDIVDNNNPEPNVPFPVNKPQFTPLQFLEKAATLNSPEEYFEFYNSNFNYSKGEIVKGNNNEIYTLYVDNKVTKTDEFTKGHIELAKYCNENSISLNIPTPDAVKKEGIKLLKDSLDVCKFQLGLTGPQEEQTQIRHEQNSENKPDPLEWYKSIKDEDVRALYNLDNLGKITDFINSPYTVGVEVPEYTTAVLNDGAISFKEEKGWKLYNTIDLESSIVLSRINDGITEYKKVDKVFYEDLIQKNENYINSLNNKMSMSGHLEAIYEYEDSLKINQDKLRQNTAGNFWHNFKVESRNSNNFNDFNAAVRNVYSRLPKKEQQKIKQMEKNYSKKTGQSFQDRLYNKFIEIQKEKAPGMSFDVRDKNSLITGQFVHQVDDSSKLPEDLKLKIDSHLTEEDKANNIKSSVIMKMTFKDVYGKKKTLPVTEMTIKNVSKENNVIILLDKKNNSKYELPLDDFIKHQREINQKISKKTAKEIKRKEKEEDIYLYR